MLKARPNKEGYWWFIPDSDGDASIVYAGQYENGDWFLELRYGVRCAPEILSGRFERVEPPSVNNAREADSRHDQYQRYGGTFMLVVTKEPPDWSFRESSTMSNFSRACIDFDRGIVELPPSITFGSLRELYRAVKRFITYSQYDWSI